MLLSLNRCNNTGNAKRILERNCPARFNRGRNQVQTIRIDEIYCCQVCFVSFKGTPSPEEHKTVVSVLTTIELNLPVEFTKFRKRQPLYI